MSKKCYHEEKGVKVNELHNKVPDPDCTCDVGVTGPAGDPELLAKGSGAYDHPQPLPPTGPAADPDLLARKKEPLEHPQTPEPTGPAAK